MPVSVEYDPSSRVMTYRVSEDPGLDEMREAVNERMANPDYAKGIHVVWDLRAADFSSLESGRLRQVSAEAARRLETGPSDARIAVIASGDLEYGMARVYEVYAGGDPSRIRVFRTEEGVESWLIHGQDPDPGPLGGRT